MTSALLFTDPYSSRETVLVDHRGKRFGLSLDPASTALPTAWSNECSHCQQLRMGKNLSLYDRKEIQIVRSQKIRYVPSHHVQSREYVVPTVGEYHVVRVWTDQHSTNHTVIIRPSIKARLTITRELGGKDVALGAESIKRSLEGPLRRFVKFVSSGRYLEVNEIVSRISPLVALQQRPRGVGYRNKCDSIDWIDLAHVFMMNDVDKPRP